MTILTRTDRISTAWSRYFEKGMLRAITSQRLMRAIFALSARLLHTLPQGCRVEEMADGALLVTPKGTEGAGLLFYVHGGGFTIGSPRTHQAAVAHIAAAAGLRAHAVRYPLAPEHPFPAAPDAVFAAYGKLVDAGDTPLAIGGDSAGGNLALLCLQRARDAGLPLPRVAVLLAPIAEMAADMEARFRAATAEYLIPAAWARRILHAYVPGHQSLTDPAISPLQGDLGGLPPTLIHAAKGEALELDARRLAQVMDDATLDVWPGLPHVWHLKAGRTPAATAACAELGAFIKAHL